MTSVQGEEAIASRQNKMDAFEAARLMLLRKRLIFGSMLACGIVAAILVILIPPTYTADATFLPPNSLSSGSPLLSELGQLGALGGASGALGGLKDTSTIYIGILGSRSVADELISEFDLARVYHTRKRSQTEKALAGHTKVIPGKDSLIAIDFQDTNPQRAANIANAYLKALSKQNDRLALTEASQRRAFFEQQLEKQKDRLADAEVESTRIQEQSGLIRPNGQAELEIETIAQTRAEISSREIQLAALSQGATGQNADVIRLRSEIDGLQKQLSDLENSKKSGRPGDVQVPTSRVPQLTLDYVRADREVKFQQALYELLFRQYESARLDESRSAPLIQVVDVAVVPDTKSGPPRAVLTLIAILLGGLISTGYVLARARYQNLAQDPVSAARLRSLHEAARLRS